jgi:WD40 repeat protein
MRIGGKNVPGHSGRIFCVKFHPQQHDVLLSSGWDRTIQIYDLREGRTVASIYGPFMSGDALDCYDDLIIAGSNRNKEVMQMFSLSKRQLITNIDWESSSRKDVEAGYVFGTRFSKPNPDFIFASSGGKNEVKIFENNLDGSASMRVLAHITEIDSPCLSIDTTKTGDNFAFGCQDGRIYLCNYKLEEGIDFEGY